MESGMAPEDAAQQRGGSADMGADGRRQRIVTRPRDETTCLAVLAARRAAGPHVEAFTDIGTTPDGSVQLVGEWLPFALDARLARLDPPSVGEVVTLLAPIGEALARCAAAGIAHTAIDERAVRLDVTGRPVLVGFDAARIVGLHADVAQAQAVDALAYRSLTARLLRRAGAAESAAQLERSDAAPAAVVETLWSLAAPEPVRLRAPIGTGRTVGARGAHTGWPGRLIAVTAADDAAPAAELGGAKRREARRSAADAADEPLRRALGRARTVLRARLAPLRQVRARVWAALGTSAALLLAAIVLLPAQSGGAHPASVGTAARSAPAKPARPARSPGSTSTPTTRASAQAPAIVGPPDAATAPKQALERLVLARARCLTAADADCLARLEQPGSPVALLDAAALHAGVDAVLVPGGTATAVSRSGSTADGRFGTVQVLAVVWHGHWLLRDVVAGESAGA